jgi:integral membrane protein
MNALRAFRAVSLVEGISWLLLLFIAMPLKYGAGWPEGVRYLGRAHGALFVLFGVALLRVAWACKWSAREVLRAGVASLIPFGAFWLERTLRAEARARAA